MATIVPQPELAQVRQSNLQATQRPVEKEQNLSDFALALVGKASEGIDTYNKENGDRLIALGASDYMNQYQRDVGFLDRKYYNQGRDIQNITETRMARQMQFFGEVNRLSKDPNVTDEQLDALGQEYQRGNVDDIYNATELDSDFKEKMYAQVIQEDAVYLGHINDTIKKVNADRYTRLKVSTGGLLYQAITTLPMNEERTTALLGARFEDLVDKAQKLKGSSLEEALKDVQPVFAGTVQTILGQLDESSPNTPEILQKLNTAAQVMMREGYIDMASPIIKDLREVTDRVYKYNGIQASLTQGQYQHAVEMGEQTYDIEDVRDRIAKVSADPNLTPEDKARLINSEWDFAESQNKAIMEGKFAKDPQYILGYGSAEEYVADNYGVEGVSEDVWYKAVTAAAEQQALQQTGKYDPMVAGLNLLDFAQNRADRYDAKLYSEGGKRLASGFRTFATNSDAQAKASPQYKAAEQQFNTVGNLYRQWTSSSVNAARADAVLAGIEDDDLRYALQEVWQDGGSMSDLREKLQNPVQAQVRRQNFDKAWNSLDLKNTDLKGSIFHNAAGSFLNKMDKSSREYQLGIAKEAIEESKSRYTSRTVSPNPEALYQMALQDGLMLRNKYSDIVVGRSTNDAFKNNQITTSKGVPMSRQLFAEVINGKRELIGKQLNISPQNVLVQLGVNGDAYFYAVKDGQVQNFTGIAGMEGTKYRNTEWKADMEKTYYARSAAGTKGTSGGMVVQSGASMFKSKQRLTVYGKGGAASVQNEVVPVDLATGVGGNVELAQVLVRSWVDTEGFALYGKRTDVQTSGQSDGVVYGWGAREDKHLAGTGLALINEFKKNQGNMPAMMKTQGKFMKYHFESSGVSTILKGVGLPQPTARALPKTAVMPIAAIYDATWFGGKGGGQTIAKAFQAGSVVEGHRIFRNSPMYMKGKAVGTPAYKRNEFFLNAIKYYHEQYKPTIRK